MTEQDEFTRGREAGLAAADVREARVAPMSEVPDKVIEKAAAAVYESMTRPGEWPPSNQAWKQTFLREVGVAAEVIAEWARERGRAEIAEIVRSEFVRLPNGTIKTYADPQTAIGRIFDALDRDGSAAAGKDGK